MNKMNKWKFVEQITNFEKNKIQVWEGDKKICYCSRNGSTSLDNARKNAHLISTAPDMYELLKELYDEGHIPAEFGFRTNAILAKAEGGAQ